MNRKITFQDLGVMEYQKCWDYQTSLFDKILAKKSLNRKNKTNTPTQNHLLFCEHPSVYTIGKNGNESNLLVNKEFLKIKNTPLYKINRGGDITYHGPGQIVGYPILDLDNFFTDIHKYLRLLEESVILTLKKYGVKGVRSKGETGVWIDVGTINARKICALGIKTSRWVTMHGFALNINTDLSYFNNIIPCGIMGKNVTSLKKELGKDVCINIIKKELKKNLVEVFNMQIV